MAKKYFTEEDSEFCYEESFYQDLMKEEGLTEIEVFEAERETGSDFFWCREYGAAFEKSDNACGVSECESYTPRNGKNGICKHNSYCYTPIKKVTLKLNTNEN